MNALNARHMEPHTLRRSLLGAIRCVWACAVCERRTSLQISFTCSSAFL